MSGERSSKTWGNAICCGVRRLHLESIRYGRLFWRHGRTNASTPYKRVNHANSLRTPVPQFPWDTDTKGTRNPSQIHLFSPSVSSTKSIQYFFDQQLIPSASFTLHLLYPFPLSLPSHTFQVNRNNDSGNRWNHGCRPY